MINELDLMKISFDSGSKFFNHQFVSSPLLKYILYNILLIIQGYGMPSKTSDTSALVFINYQCISHFLALLQFDWMSSTLYLFNIVKFAIHIAFYGFRPNSTLVLVILSTPKLFETRTSCLLSWKILLYGLASV